MSKKTTLAEEYRAFRRAMDEGNHAEIIKYGIKLTKRKDFTPPPLIIKTIGTAYANIVLKLQKKKPFDEEATKKNLRRAWDFLWQAYCQVGENVFSVSDLVCLITVGYHQELGKYAVLHDIIKETITKLKSGEYPPIPKEQYLILLEALRKCCLEKGYIAESIDCIDEYLRLID